MRLKPFAEVQLVPEIKFDGTAYGGENSAVVWEDEGRVEKNRFPIFLGRKPFLKPLRFMTNVFRRSDL